METDDCPVWAFELSRFAVCFGFGVPEIRISDAVASHGEFQGPPKSRIATIWPDHPGSCATLRQMLQVRPAFARSGDVWARRLLTS
jgi:hypothetical protein